MKLIWRNHPEDFIFFVKFYEWSFKILGWLTALGALKFAYVKTGNGLFVAIYAALLCIYSFPLVTVLYFELDFPKMRSPLLKRMLGRLPPLAVLLALWYSLNWAITHTVDGIANIQLTANCNTPSVPNPHPAAP
jgi:cellobiose-specific phosphotransferase system component IIC